MHYVIIGNSAAAIGAIEAIRRHDPENPITVVADEPHHVYSRPLISYLLGGMVDEGRMDYRPRDFYTRQRVETMLGVRVTQVNPTTQSLMLADGRTLSYDRLLIATGGRPFVPPTPGVELEGVFTFTSLDDARRIARYIEQYQARSALIVGGGLIGLKTAEALMARAMRVVIVELADRILSMTFDHTASKLAESFLRRAGADVRTGLTIKEIVAREGHVGHAILQSDERVECDLVVFAIGVRPNVGLIPPEAGIRINRGIVVNRRMQTSVPTIYAAGDCAEGYDMLLGENRPIAIWPNAYRQGYVAGCNMAGVEREDEGGLPMNAVEVCGVPTISVGLAGLPNGNGYEVMERYDRETSAYRRLVLLDNRLVGATCIGNVDRAGIYTGLIRDHINIAPFKNHLLAGNFGLISLPREYRKQLVVGEGIEM